jgi:toxin ParE1/3/4
VIVRRRQADLDLLEQAAFIAQDDPDAARRLFDAVASTLSMLEGRPRLGRRVPFPSRHLRGLRMRGVTEFPNQIVFYLATKDGIEVVRILHAARDLPEALR